MSGIQYWLDKAKNAKFMSAYCKAINRALLEGELRTLYAMLHDEDIKNILVEKLKNNEISEIEEMIAQKNN